MPAAKSSAREPGGRFWLLSACQRPASPDSIKLPRIIGAPGHIIHCSGALTWRPVIIFVAIILFSTSRELPPRLPSRSLWASGINLERWTLSGTQREAAPPLAGPPEPRRGPDPAAHPTLPPDLPRPRPPAHPGRLHLVPQEPLLLTCSSRGAGSGCAHGSGPSRVAAPPPCCPARAHPELVGWEQEHLPPWEATPWPALGPGFTCMAGLGPGALGAPDVQDPPAGDPPAGEPPAWDPPAGDPPTRGPSCRGPSWRRCEAPHVCPEDRKH